MSYRLQDGSQRFETNSDIKQVGGKEEIVEVAQNWEDEVPQTVQEWLKFKRKISVHWLNKFHICAYVICEGDTCFPNLVAPVNVQNSAIGISVSIFV